MSKNKRKLHIGGTQQSMGWEIFNALPLGVADHVGNANDLSRFNDNTFDEIYGSHILEHFDYQKELIAVLKEWYRVLNYGGKIYISVPDLEQLCHLLLQKKSLNIDEQFQIMRMMFGGHIDQYDYHLVGLTHGFMEAYMGEAGFEKITRVGNFNLFDDMSNLAFKGVQISLNITGVKIKQ